MRIRATGHAADRLRRGLILLLAILGVAAAGHAQMLALGATQGGLRTLVICSGQGTRSITVDRNGNPATPGTGGGMVGCSLCCLVPLPGGTARLPARAERVAGLTVLRPRQLAVAVRRFYLRPPLRAPPIRVSRFI